MDSPLEDVEYLARSAHRPQVLGALVEQSSNRQDLMEATGVARATLGRTLEEFRRRGWVVRRGQRYEVTVLGETVLDAFTDLLAVIEATQTLRPVVEWFPFEHVEVDLMRLADARVVVSTPVDVFGPVLQATDRIAVADSMQIFAGHYVHGIIEALYEAVDERGATVELVVTDGVIDSVQRAGRSATTFAALLAADAVTAYRSDGAIDFDCLIAGETVLISLTDERGSPRGVVETDDAAVRAWAVDRMARYRAAQTPITAADL